MWVFLVISLWSAHSVSAEFSSNYFLCGYQPPTDYGGRPGKSGEMPFAGSEAKTQGKHSDDDGVPGSKAATSDNIELLEAIRFAIGGKNVQKTKNYTHTNTADRLSEVKKEDGHRKRDEDLSDGEDTKLKNKN